MSLTRGIENVTNFKADLIFPSRILQEQFIRPPPRKRGLQSPCCLRPLNSIENLLFLKSEKDFEVIPKPLPKVPKVIYVRIRGSVFFFFRTRQNQISRISRS